MGKPPSRGTRGQFYRRKRDQNEGAAGVARDSLTRPAHTPSPPPPVPDALVAAIAGDRSVVVLGAGASAQAGYPTGEHLLHQLVQELGSAVPASIREAAAGSSRGWGPAVRVAEFGTIIEALLSVTSRDHLIEVVRGIFARVTPDRALFTTLSRLSWRVVLPLAWDSFADEFFLTYRANRGLTYRANRGAPRRRIALEDTAELRNAIRASDRLLLRALGDLDRPASLSLTIEDFRRALARTPDFQRQLTLLLQTQTFLFIGVGVDTLKNFLQAIGADLEIPEQRHFALIPDDPANDIYRSPLKRYGIELLEYDAHDDHVEVARFVERLAAQVTHEKSSSAELPMRAAVDPDLAARRIARVRLHNIGLFDELDIKFPSGPLPDTESLPWTVVFAPNGCGKSTFLRAIGLVMAGHDPRVRDAGAHLLKAGQNDGWIEVQIGSDTLRTTLVRDRGGVLVRSSQTTPLEAAQAIVLGFPSLRGAPSPNPKGPMSLEPTLPEPSDVLPLVLGQVDGRFADFKQWLLNTLDLAGHGDSRATAMKELIDKIIRELVPGQFDSLAPLDSSWVIKVRRPREGNAPFEEIPLEDISQGMSSIFNWVGVLVQRLHDFYPDSARPAAEAAIVLVDEIDVHLHPEWQRKLVTLTRHFFPRAQVIATSHSPLLAGALRGPEMCILAREPGSHGVFRLPFEIDLFGYNSRDILNSVVFSMQTDRNPKAERTIREYFGLFQKVKLEPAEQARLEQLEQELKGIGYGENPMAPPPEPSVAEQLSPDQMAKLKEMFGSAPTLDSVLKS